MEYAISLGSNLGDRLQNLRQARDEIQKRLGPDTIESSKVYQTEPVGVREKYRHLDYLNAVLIFDSAASPAEVSDIIHAIEADMGRVRTADRFAPRPIDIDILYAGSEMSDSEDLTLPHPRWAERRFVVQPLADLRPGLIFPREHRTVEEILSTLPLVPAVTLHADSL